MIKNTGKSSEAFFEDTLKNQGAHVYRFEDYLDVTRGLQSKRKIISTKPSDFIVTYRGITAYVEVKSISTGSRFDFSRIEKGQWQTAFKVTREKSDGLYLFYLHFIESGHWYQVPAEQILNAVKKSVREDEITQFRCYMENNQEQTLHTKVV